MSFRVPEVFPFPIPDGLIAGWQQQRHRIAEEGRWRDVARDWPSQEYRQTLQVQHAHAAAMESYYMCVFWVNKLQELCPAPSR